MQNDLVYLETYILQKDMRIRLPKSVITNMKAEKGKTSFEIYYDRKQDCLVLKKSDKTEQENSK